MAYEKVDGFVVLTQDLDFSAILAATNAAMPSVVQVRGDDTSPEKIGPQVLLR